jgi:hypothetical protein
MNYVERLNEALRLQLRHPWTNDKSGGERVWFLVFEPQKLRTVLARKEMFRLTTEAAGKTWVEVDLTRAFGEWMANHRYAQRYFKRPSLATTLPGDFANSLVHMINQEITERGVDENTLLVLSGTESLYGIDKLSHVTRMIEDLVPGRLLVLFPGEYNEPQYRFLDARDGWNYLAVPIVPVSGRGLG